jgi:hypothetical protein
MERKPISRPYNCVQTILEDIPGGGVVSKTDFKASSVTMKEGVLLGVDTYGIYHLTKTARLWSAAASNTTTLRIYKNHEIKPGNILINTSKSGTSRTVLSVNEDDSFSYDSIELDAPLGIALLSEAVLVEVSSSGVTGSNAVLKWPPKAVAISPTPVDLLKANTGCGLLIRGRVSKELMTYAIDDTLEALLPLIRFVHF